MSPGSRVYIILYIVYVPAARTCVCVRVNVAMMFK